MHFGFWGLLDQGLAPGHEIGESWSGQAATVYLYYSILASLPPCPFQYLRVTGAGSKMKEGGSRLPAFHPNLFTYVVASGPASTVPPSYIALGRACVAEDPLQRPTFDQVLKALELVRRDSERMKEEAAVAAVSSSVFGMPRTGHGWFRRSTLAGGKGRRRCVMDGGLGSRGLEQQLQVEEAAEAAGIEPPRLLEPECVSMDSLDVAIAARAARMQPKSPLGSGSGMPQTTAPPADR